MKTKLLFLAALFTGAMLYAQTSNVVIFNQEGQPFYAIVNGIQQNSNYETNIAITDLLPGAYKVKIIFKNNQLSPIDKNIYLEANNQYTFQIKQTKKGAYVLRPFSITPLAQAPTPPATQQVIVYHTSPAPVTQTTTTTTTQTVQTTTSPAGGEQVNMSVSVPGEEISINAGTTVNTTNVQTTTTYSETTTVTTQSTGSYYDANGIEHPDPKPNAYYNMPGYNGPVGCPYPMTPQDFSQAKSSISAKSFEDSKLTMAKQIVRSNCLTAQQVKELMLLFDFEDSKLDLAKFAYDYTFDLGNYYKVNDAFEFESSIDELNTYINGR